MKLKTRAERLAVFDDLVAWIEKGFSVASFPALSPLAIKYYLVHYPGEFNQDRLAQANRLALKQDEAKLLAATSGRRLEGFDPRYYNHKAHTFWMRNRYGHDTTTHQDWMGLLLEDGGAQPDLAVKVEITVKPSDSPNQGKQTPPQGESPEGSGNTNEHSK